jgi:hypothetical protein
MRGAELEAWGGARGCESGAKKMSRILVLQGRRSREPEEIEGGSEEDRGRAVLALASGQRPGDLEIEASARERRWFLVENARVEAQLGAYTAELGKVDGENAVLRARHGELAGRLQALGGVLEIFQVAGAAVDIPEIPDDPLLRPWQSPFAPQLAATGADVFQF